MVAYFSSNMIIKDKRSYLFDTSLSSINNLEKALEIFYLSKLRTVEFASETTDLIASFKTDEDLFQIRSYGNEELSGYIENDIYQKGRIFLTESEIKKINSSSEEVFLGHDIQKGVIYTNHKFLSAYRGRYGFLIPPDDEIKKQAAEVYKNKKNSYYIHVRAQNAPRFILFSYDEKNQAVNVFDYFFDGFLEKFVNQSNLEVMMVTPAADVVFNSRPENLTKNHISFFKRFLKKMNKENNADKALVREYRLGEDEYIWASSPLNYFPGYVLFAGISTREAYKVTTFLVLTTILYIVIMISAYSVISIFLSRSITRPLDKFIIVIQSISNGQYSARVGEQSTSELQAMATTFNSMVDKIQEYNNKLIEYNRTLEQKVEERTLKLKKANNFITTMVDSLAQGLLVFGKDGTCLDLYTKACEKLLGSSPANKSLSKLIQSPDPDLMGEWINNLYEEMIPFESLVELGPKSIPCDFEYKHKDFRHVTLEFFPMRNEEEKIENVVMVATDKTREFKAQQQVIEEQRYVKFVTKVLKDKRNFLRFVDLFENSMSESRDTIQAESKIDQNSFMRLLHSMKGSAAFYNLEDIVKFLHQFETLVSSEGLSVAQAVDKINEVLGLLGNHLKRLKDFISENKASVLEIQEASLREFHKQLLVKHPESAIEFSQKFLTVPVKNYVEQYVGLVQDVAQKVGKRVAPVEIINGEILVDMNRYQAFFDSCIHVFRNAVDHGMEKPEERAQAKKSELGRITIKFQVDEGLLIFEVSDDGKGINPARIRSKMQELDYAQELVEQSDERVIYHIFDPSFSTADKVTDLSGRGVGLYDVKENLSKLGGTIELVSVFGQGTDFRFYIPVV
jgi:two-component system chemotaxis sensor kinase CheA